MTRFRRFRRAACPVCGRDCAVTGAGRIVDHNHSRGARCPGVGRKATELGTLTAEG